MGIITAILALKLVGLVLQFCFLFGLRSFDKDIKRTLAGVIMLLWGIAGVLDFVCGSIFLGVLSFIIVALFVPALLE